MRGWAIRIGLVGFAGSGKTTVFNTLTGLSVLTGFGGETSAPVVTWTRTDWYDVHLLCSDGLTTHVPDGRIAERLAAMTSARAVCEQLLQDALDGGGSDNITRIVGRAV